MNAAFPAFRNAQGLQWTGPPVLERTDLTVVIAIPDSRYERQREAYAAGRVANEEGDFAAAATAYENALGIEPNDGTAKSFLAGTYVALRRYDDAIPLLRQQRDRAQGSGRVRAAQALALAHLATGDEPSAVQVLQAEGLRGQELAEGLTQLRARLRNRP